MALKFQGIYNTSPTTDDRKPFSDDDDFALAVKAMVDDAVDYIDGFIAPDRALATQFYRGDPLGNEQEGRSQIVMTEVRDSVQQIVPELLRIFAGSDKLGEFSPTSIRTVEQADQATDYCNHIFWNDNPGFEILHSVCKDALVRKTGIAKWYWSEDVEVSEAEYTSLSHAQVMMLQTDPEVEILKADPGEESGEDSQGEPTFDVKIRRERKKDRVVIETIPPEEFLCARDTKNIKTSTCVGHRSLKTVSELIAMGYDREEIELHAGGDDHYYLMNTEAVARNPAINTLVHEPPVPDSSQRQLIYTEAYCRIDRDGDGIAELHKTCLIGVHLLHDEVVTYAPFAFFCPDPEPHMLIGQSVADQTMDLQIIKSAIVRNTLDSLAQSINPRTWGVEGQVNFDDLLNNEVGGVIRMRQPGMAGEFTSTFVGQASLPVLQYMDMIEAKRTGITDASRGLDPDILQSTTDTAVRATVQGAQTRIELIARIFAGNGIKDLFQGILKTVIQHQDRPRIIRLRGKFVEMDPRFWDSDLDFKTNVALGRGTDQDKMKFLVAVATKQEQIIQMLGPTNPLAPIDKYRETLAQLCHLAGFMDDTKFFGQVDPQQMQQAMQAASQNKPQDPTVMLAQIEQAKVQVQAQKNQADVAQRQQADLMEHHRELFKMRLDAMVKIATAQITSTGQADIAQIEAMISRDEAITTAQIQAGADMHANTADMVAQLGAAHMQANAPPTNGAAQ